MRLFLVLLFLVSAPILSGRSFAADHDQQAQGQFVKSITIQGFVLDDKDQFVRIFKPYRNKYLTAVDIDTILQELQERYEQAGYQGLISIEYQIQRKRLTFSVSLIK